MFIASLFTREARGGGGRWGGGGEWNLRAKQDEYLFRPQTPYTVKSSFCTRVQFFHDSIFAFNDRIKVRGNRGL